MLERLNVPFTCRNPEIDESRLPGESITQQVLRLAESKVRAVQEDGEDALIIGSDQLAVLHGEALGKPVTHENAIQQLRRMSGQHVCFMTSLCLLNTRTDNIQYACIPFDIYYRELSDDQIERYLQKEQPYHCAGSFKSEALGVTLIERMKGPDPSALVGLPLITLTDMLLNQDYIIP